MTDNERAMFRANIDAALASFKMKSGWRGLSAEQAVEAFSSYVKNDHELSWGDPSRTDRTWALNMLLNAGFTRGMIEERSGDPLQVTSEMGNVLMEIDESLDGTGGLCPGVFWFHDDEYDLFTVVDNRGDECRVTRFIEERNCMNFLDGLDPMSNWDRQSLDPDFDAKVNKLADETECPIMPDQDLSEWDMARYGYGHEGCGMLPVGAERAEVLLGRIPLHQLHPDNTSSPVMTQQDIHDHSQHGDGLFGVTLVDWMDHLAESGIIDVETTPRWRAMNLPDEHAAEDKDLFDVPLKDGGTEEARVEVGYYSQSKNLLLSYCDGIKEPDYGWDITKADLTGDYGKLPLLQGAVNAYNPIYDIPKFLEESGLAEPTGFFQMGRNTYYEEERPYPVYEFKLDKLMEIDPEMTAQYLKERGFTVEQAREYQATSKTEQPLEDLLKEAKERARDANQQGQENTRKPPEMDR